MSTTAATLIASRYRLTRRIAAGGMGEVWEATDQVLGRNVAVKLLRADFADDKSSRQRFHAEALAVARLMHPGVVGVYDYGEHGGAPFLVMELVRGESLSSVLRRGPLRPEAAMSIVAQAASVLAAAHTIGIVHRDVKPANLLLRPDGTVKVADFGIARESNRSTVIDTGTAMGTAAYMSPEQVRGDAVSSSSDVYSLGIVAYQCLTGTRPFSGETSTTVALGHLQRPMPPLPPGVPPDIARLVTAMLVKDPARRPSSARAVADAASRLAGSFGEGSAQVGAPCGDIASDGGATMPHLQTETCDDILAAQGRWADSHGADGLSPAPHRRRVHRRSRGWASVAVGLVSVIVLVVGVVFTAGAAPALVRVPNLRGELQRSAQEALNTAHLARRDNVVDVAGAAANLVVGQRPGPGAHVKPGTRIVLTVASGYVVLRRRSLDAMPYESAVATLRREGLVPTQLVVASTGSHGIVVSFHPSGRLREGTVVTLSVTEPRVAAATASQTPFPLASVPARTQDSEAVASVGPEPPPGPTNGRGGPPPPGRPGAPRGHGAPPGTGPLSPIGPGAGGTSGPGGGPSGTAPQ